MNTSLNQIKMVTLTGQKLSLEEVVAVSRFGARVQFHEEAKVKMARSRAVVERLVDAREKVYGLTTGFGSKRDIIIESDELEQLQINLIRSHACGVGPALSEDTVRATMLLRANTLARGNSGIRIEVVQMFLEFLNRGIYPWVPSRGSLGASGDLAPLSHLALALCNDPDAKFYERDCGHPLPTAPTLNIEDRPNYIADPIPWKFGPPPAGLFEGKDKLEPVILKAKEGLALNNGTQVSTAIGLLAIFDAQVLLESAELVCALSLEGVKAVRGAFDPRLHEARPLEGQRETAARLRCFTDDSQILDVPLNTARMFRARKALESAAEVLAEEGADGKTLSQEATQAAKETEGLADKAPMAIEEAGAEAKNLTGKAKMVLAYKKALIPIRARVTKLYTKVLESTLAGDAPKSRDYLADALAQLQMALPEAASVQDDYSFRCTPQVLGAARKVLSEVRGILIIEANSATDNPLIFPPESSSEPGDWAVADCIDAVVSGGNFHGEAIAINMDHLTIALAEVANISERRTAHLVDGSLSNGLPSLLVEKSGLNSGLMIPQYVAAGLVSENKVLSHPASVDSIPSCENTEDHVSMSPIAALKCRDVLTNAERVVAIELLTAWQAVTFRRPLKAGVGTERLWESLADAGMEPILEDRVLYTEIQRVLDFLRTGAVWRIARDIGDPAHAP